MTFWVAKGNGHVEASLGNCSCLKQAEEMDEILVIKSRGKPLALRVETCLIGCVMLLLGDVFSFARSLIMFGCSLCNIHV